MFKFSKTSLEKLDNVHNDLETVMRFSIIDSPYDFGITYGYRSPEEQNNLYQKGRTGPGTIVTYCDGYTRKSKHNYKPSQAVDIICYDEDGKPTWDEKYYKSVATHILDVADRLYEDNKIEHKIVWGGVWEKLKDYPHFQI